MRDPPDRPPPPSHAHPCKHRMLLPLHHASTASPHTFADSTGSSSTMRKRQKSILRVAIFRISALIQSRKRNSSSVPLQQTVISVRARTLSNSVTTAVNARAACSNACACVRPHPRMPISAPCRKCSRHASLSSFNVILTSRYNKRTTASLSVSHGSLLRSINQLRASRCRSKR